MTSDSLLDPTFLYTLDRLALISRRARAGTFKGERRSPRRGGSVEFADYREYAPGDDFRQVDWNAYARLERLFLRLFVEEEDATVHILLDASKSMDWGEPGKWTYARRVAAALGYIALIGTDRLMAAAVGTANRADGARNDFIAMRPLRGKKQAVAWFDWLATLRPGGRAAPDVALLHYASSVRRAGPLIVIGDLMDDGWQEGIKRLAEHRYELMVLHILSPEETNPAFEGDLKLVDSESAAGVEITADYDLLARYRDRVQTWQTEWQRFCAARAINYARIETSTPFEELILSFLRQRGVLK